MPPQEPASAPSLFDPLLGDPLLRARRQPQQAPLLAPDPLRSPSEPDPLLAGVTRSRDLAVDKARRILQIRAQSGLPETLVTQHFEALDKLGKANQLDPDHLRLVSPALAEFLQQSPARIAASPPEELARLRNLEAQFGWTNGMMRGVQNMQSHTSGFLEAFGELMGNEWATTVGREGRERNRLEALAYGRGPELSRAFDSASDFGRYVYELVGEQIPVLGVSLTSGLAGAKVGAAVGSFIPGLGTAWGATIGGVIGAFAPSFVMGTGEVQAEMKELNPYAVDPTSALVGGSFVGAFDAIVPGKIGTRLVRTFGRESAEALLKRVAESPLKPKFWVRNAHGAVTGMLSEAITESLQEAVAAKAAAVGADRRLDWNALGPRMIEAAVAGGLVGGIFESATEAVTYRKAKADHVVAEQVKAFYKAVGEGVATSEALLQVPEAYRPWLVATAANGPAANTYIPIAQWEEYWQKAGENPHAVAAAVTGNPHALEEAKEGGTGLLTVETADYATKLAGTVHNNFFQAEVKFDPRHDNLREVNDRIAQAEQRVKAEKAAIAEQQQTQEQVVGRRLYDMMLQRGTPKWQAGPRAALWAKRYVVAAVRNNQDPVERFDANPLQAFYSLANGQPLNPANVPGVAPPTPGAPPADQAPPLSADPLLNLPVATMTEARESGLTAAFDALPPADFETTLDLAAQGFTPEEVTAFDLAGLSTAGRMSKAQYADYREVRATRGKAAAAAAPSPMADLPASVAQRGETRDQATQRQRTHLAALVGALTRAAQQVDPTVTQDTIRAEIDRRLAYDRERLDAIESYGAGQTLLRKIAKAGGIWWDERTLGERGEVLKYAREGRDQKTKEERGGRDSAAYDVKEWDDLRNGETTRGVVPTWNGVAGVFRKDGLTPDGMAEALREEDEYPNIWGPSELFDAIDLALRARPEAQSELPGTADLARLGIDPAARWWDTRWGMDPSAPDENVDDGDISFDPSEFGQALREPRALPREFSQQKAPAPIPTSLDQAAGFEGISAAVAAHVKKTGEGLEVGDLSDLIQSLVDKAKAKLGLEGALDTTDPRVQDYLVRALTKEGLDALRDHPESIGWYNLKVHQAREVMALKYPELLTDDDAWFTFTFLLAVLSNRTNVSENFKQATQGYEHFKHTGLLPTNLGRGVSKKNIGLALEFFNRQVRERGGVTGGGVAAFREMLMQQHRVGDLKKSHEDFKNVAGLVDQIVYAASVLGPKIGNGFLLNLQGIYSQLTFDVWWVRTWARLTGSLDQSNPVRAAENRRDLRAGLKGLNADERLVLTSLVGQVQGRYSNEELDALAVQLNAIAAETGGRGEMLKLEVGGPRLDLVRRLANRLKENLRGYRETPGSDTERAMMDLVARRALANIQAAGYTDLTAADFQAVLWYPEKRLYETAKQGKGVSAYDPDEAPDYANAAVEYARGEGLDEAAIQGALVTGQGRAAGARRAAAGGLGVAPVQPGGPVQPGADPGRARGLPDAGRVTDPDTGEFFQRSATTTVGSALASFYSRLEQPVRDAKVDQTKGRDWKAIIKAAKSGINLEEYAAVGVDALEDTRTYTRGEVLAHLHQHRIVVDVVELADPSQLIDPEVLRREADEIHAMLVEQAIEAAIDDGRGPQLLTQDDVEVDQVGTRGVVRYRASVDGRTVGGEMYTTEDDAVAAALQYVEERNVAIDQAWRADMANGIAYADAETYARENLRDRFLDREAKYSGYVEPGAVEGSYRELFLTAPNAQDTLAQHQAQRQAVEEALAFARRGAAGEAGENLPGGDTLEGWGVDVLERLLASDDFRTHPLAGFLALSDTDNERLDGPLPGLSRQVAAVGGAAAGWKDGHPAYSAIKNPIVRLRFNVRRVTTAAGVVQTVLFLEEVQPPVKQPGARLNEFEKMPALFQNTWRELAMRFALQYAATHHYDAVAWTTGQMQLERYPGIRQEAQVITYRPETLTLGILGRDGAVLLSKQGVGEADVTRFLGEDLATRVLSSQLERDDTGLYYRVSGGTGKHVGGEGLVTLYDKQLGQTANKLPVMRRSQVTTGTLAMPGTQLRATYDGPTVTAAQLRADATAAMRDVRPEAMGATLIMQARDVAKEMDGGLTFQQAMQTHGSIALAERYGGTLETVAVPAVVPAITLTPTLSKNLLTRGQEFFQQGQRRPPGNATYDRTLFGEPLTPTVPEPRLATRTELVTQTSRALPVSSVQSPADLAAALSYLSYGAQERFDALVTDAEGRPLAIIGGFKGTVGEVQVATDVLLADALGVPGAARVWLAHNHPSGDPRLSDADRTLLARVQLGFTNAGLEVEGIIAIGAGFGVDRRWNFTGSGAASPADDRTGGVRAPTPGVAISVPVQERELVAVDKLDTRSITTVALAQAIVPAVARGQFGIAFMDSLNRITGFVPLDQDTALALKEEGRARALYQTWAETGSRRAFIYQPTAGVGTVQEGFNVAQALTAVGVSVLDVIGPDGSLVGLPRTAFTGVFTQPAPGDGGVTRGSYNRFTNWIRLIAGAENLSTFLHESGHAFLHELFTDALAVSLQDPTTTTELQQGLVRDAHTILKWFTFEGSLGDFLALSTEDQRSMHEQWARSFEVYLMTGQAPSADLRSLFAEFRAWLLSVYRLFRNPDQAALLRAVSQDAGFEVTLPTEVKEVMDRLLATDEAIEAARAESGVTALFADRVQAGMDELQWAAYEQVRVDANTRTREQIQTRVLEDWRKAQQSQWQRDRAAVREQVVIEANSNPILVAQSVIRTGKMPDGSIPVFGDGRPLKLSKAAIVAMKGNRFARSLPRPYVYTVTGGLHPDVVAELTGFTSGDALLEALVGASSPNATIDKETDLRMQQQFGDQVLDGIELQDLAEQALHEHRGEVIAAELQALTRGMAQASMPTPAQLKAAAEMRVARLEVRQLQPGLFLQAATRSSRAAFEAFARNDRAAAIKHKVDEATSLALYRAVANARDRADKSARLMREFQTSAGRRKTLLTAGQDYLDKVDDILNQYEFVKVSQRSLERRISLRKWVENQQKNGLPVQVPEWMIDDTRHINYTRLTTEELAGVRATVEHIAHLARLKKNLLDARAKKELAEVRSEIADSIHAHLPTQPRIFEPRVGAAWRNKFTGGIHYSHLKLATILRVLDGGKDDGPLWNYVGRRVNDAANSEASKGVAAAFAITQLFSRHYTSAERLRFKRLRRVPELDQPGKAPVSLTHEALVMLALNQGNETNRQRTHDGHGWTQDQVQKALDAHLTKRDFDFAQDVWDYIDTYWPEIVAKQQRVAGAVPEKVLATPVFTRFGEYRGGYFPISFDNELSGRNLSLDLANAAKLAEAAAYVQSTTARGHLERRVEGDVTENPVRLDFGVITQHLSQVIHDLTHHEMLIDVGRILDPKHAVGTAIEDTLGVKAFENISTALRDIALGDVAARHETEQLQSYLASGVTVVGLGWSLSTASLQWIGYTQTVQRIGWQWAAKGLSSFWRGALTMQNTTKAIMEESPAMRDRWNPRAPRLHDVRERLGIHSGQFPTWMDQGLRAVTADKVTQRAIVDSFQYMTQRMQQMVDKATYLGAKAKAMADPANRLEDGQIDEAKCVALAEQAVIDAQGGNAMKDRSAVQRGSPGWKQFLNFFSFFNVTYNAMAVRGHHFAANPKNAFAVGRLAVDFLLLFTIPTVLTHLTRSVIRGTAGDELDDPEELAWTLAREHAAYMTGTLVLVRELSTFIEGTGRYEGPAGTRGISAIGKAVVETGQAIVSGEIDEQFFRSLNAASGVLFHYPAAQVDKTVRGIMALMNGETQNPLAPFVGPPPKR